MCKYGGDMCLPQSFSAWWSEACRSVQHIQALREGYDIKLYELRNWGIFYGKEMRNETPNNSGLNTTEVYFWLTKKSKLVW